MSTTKKIVMLLFLPAGNGAGGMLLAAGNAAGVMLVAANPSVVANVDCCCCCVGGGPGKDCC